jgi:hypothetical protein
VCVCVFSSPFFLYPALSILIPGRIYCSNILLHHPVKCKIAWYFSFFHINPGDYLIILSVLILFCWKGYLLFILFCPGLLLIQAVFFFNRYYIWMNYFWHLLRWIYDASLWPINLMKYNNRFPDNLLILFAGKSHA